MNRTDNTRGGGRGELVRSTGVTLCGTASEERGTRNARGAVFFSGSLFLIKKKLYEQIIIRIEICSLSNFVV